MEFLGDQIAPLYSHHSTAMACMSTQYSSDSLDEYGQQRSRSTENVCPSGTGNMYYQESAYSDYEKTSNDGKRRRYYKKTTTSHVESKIKRPSLPPIAPTTHRKKSSEKERQRNVEIKEALHTLSRSMPYVKKDLSRIRTLRLAAEYMKHLNRILRGEKVLCEHTGKERPLGMSDFEKVVIQEIQTNNSYKDRAELELASSSSSPFSVEHIYNDHSSTIASSVPSHSPKQAPTMENLSQVPAALPNRPYYFYQGHNFLNNNNESIC